MARKLGIAEGMTVALVGAPSRFEEWLLPLPPGVTFTADATAPAEIVVVFATDGRTLRAGFTRAMKRIPPNGAIWIAWPKRLSKVPTDITEDRLREWFLPTGMVDTKVCAVSDVWSGLRFVLRKELRPAR